MSTIKFPEQDSPMGRSFALVAVYISNDGSVQILMWDYLEKYYYFIDTSNIDRTYNKIDSSYDFTDINLLYFDIDNLNIYGVEWNFDVGLFKGYDDIFPTYSETEKWAMKEQEIDELSDTFFEKRCGIPILC